MKLKQWFVKTQVPKGVCIITHVAQQRVLLTHFTASAQSEKPPLVHLDFFNSIDISSPVNFSDQLKDNVIRLGLEKANCIYVLPLEEYRLILLEAPNVPDTEMTQAAKWLVKDLIDFPVSEIALDVFDAPIRVGQKRKIYAVVTRLKYLQAISGQIEAAQLKLTHITITHLGIRAFLSQLPQAAQGVGFLHVHEQEVHFLIVKDGILYLERKLIHFSTEISEVNDLSQSENLLLEIQRSLDFYQNQMGQAAPEKLYLDPVLGIHAVLIQQLLLKLLVKVEVLDINQWIEYEKPLSQEEQHWMLPLAGMSLNFLQGQ
ncbi:MAG TPA: hypothetical protein DIC51_04285 [Coxiellaceae bacterium]|nr:hypothetical protein [Coxiellaceae bacterium]